MQTSLSPIVKGLTDYKNENITRFHMPVTMENTIFLNLNIYVIIF